MRFASPFAAAPLAGVALLVFAPVACNNGDGSDAGTDGSTESGTTAGTTSGTTSATTAGDASGGTTAPAAACSGDSDCRAYPSHCDTCACLAVGARAPDPTCSGTDVSCLIDPCLNKVAKCKSGGCVIEG